MAPLELDGGNLGQKHRNYNKILKDAIENKKDIIQKLNYDDNDIENLLKIDIASHNRNIEFILNVLRNEDMLYVSRAIKKATWLITDPQYAHIINPEYLHNELFPYMTNKAKNKLILHIRLNLKDEKRCEGFYNYFKEKDSKTALKWLPYCSVSFIESVITDVEKGDVDGPLLKRLCEKSINVLEWFKKDNDHYDLRQRLTFTQFLLKVDAEKYLDIIKDLEEYQIPKFKKMHTEFLMKHCHDRIVNNFDKYYNHVDPESFIKNLKKDEIKDFLLKYTKDKKVKYWFIFSTIKLFVKYMPVEGRFQFLKDIFIDKKIPNDGGPIAPLSPNEIFDEMCRAAPPGCCGRSIVNTRDYHWYRFAPFEVALKDLKNAIRIESNPQERLTILTILLNCAARNNYHLQIVLQYYHEKHINEPFKFKIQFVNHYLTRMRIQKIDESSWKMLNELFYTMEVYDGTTNNVQNCIQYIIVYKILNEQEIPEIIEKNFSFNSLKSFSQNVDKDATDKIFSYLYKSLVTKIENQKRTSESELNKEIELLEKLTSLLIDWEKDITEFPIIKDRMKEIINTNKENSWKCSLLNLYNAKKSWKKYMFEESILINPSKETFFNALKHDAELFNRFKTEIDITNTPENRKFIEKLRTYWSLSLANDWSSMYFDKMTKSSNNQAMIRGLCLILTPKKLTDFVKEHVPKESKMTWSESNLINLNTCKYIAKNMHLSRPPPSPELVLLYAEGDYLQYALPSLNAVLYNINTSSVIDVIPQLLKGPVSIQKHGIRLAFSKLPIERIKTLFFETVNTSKNASIRAVLFKETFKLLSRGNSSSKTEEIWEFFSALIDTLTTEENRSIYATLGKAEDLPISIRPLFSAKSYKFLKSLPPNIDCNNLLRGLQKQIIDITQHLDTDFVAGIVLKILNDSLSSYDWNNFTELSISFLLSTKDEEVQIERYEKTFPRILERCLEEWDRKEEDVPNAKSVFSNYIHRIFNNFPTYILEKKFPVPIKVLTKMLEKMEQMLPIRKHYVLLRSFKLLLIFATLLQKCLAEGKEPEISPELSPQLQKRSKYYLNIVPEFGKYIIQCLKEDTKAFFPSVHTLLGLALTKFLDNIDFEAHVRLDLFEYILDDNCVESYFLVLPLTKVYTYLDMTKVKQKQLWEKLLEHPSEELKMYFYEILEQ